MCSFSCGLNIREVEHSRTSSTEISSRLSRLISRSLVTSQCCSTDNELEPDQMVPV